MALARTSSATAARPLIPWEAIGVIALCATLAGTAIVFLAGFLGDHDLAVNVAKKKFPVLEDAVKEHMDPRGGEHDWSDRTARPNVATPASFNAAANNNKPGNGSDRATGGAAPLKVNAELQLARGTESELFAGLAARIEVWFKKWPELRRRSMADALGLDRTTVTWEEIKQVIAKAGVSDLRTIIKDFDIP